MPSTQLDSRQVRVPNRTKMKVSFSKNNLKLPNIFLIPVTIVVASRLVYRKGIDLLAEVLWRYKDRPSIKFLIAGDGPKRDLLEEIREKGNMQERVEIIGAVEHSKVRDVLIQGDIFLNTSLTEAYCMAIVEAASCGLQVVSTKVGGIPEVLPSNLIILKEPNIDEIYEGLEEAIKIHYIGDTSKILCPFKRNETVKKLYNWKNVTCRTERVYEQIINEPDPKLGQKILAPLKSGVWPYLLLVTLCYFCLRLMDYLLPKERVQRAKDMKTRKTF